MAKFIYRMQNILNIKLRMETQAKTEYAQMAAKLNEEEQAMSALILRKRNYESEAKELASKKLDILQIKHCNEAIKTMQELINKQAIRVRIAEKNLDLARKKLNTAMQERKIQEKLKENAFEEFKLDLNAQEKKEIDELVSFTYNNNVETGD